MADYANEKIVFDYAKMNSCVTTLRGILEKYKNAADKFNEEFNTAITGWEGDSKDKMKSLIDGAVNSYLKDTIPGIVEALAAILEENAKQMAAADRQIADNIPQSI